MEKVVLKATKRAVTGKQVNQLRREGLLPGVVYGYKVEPTPISMDAHSTSLALLKLTSSSVITLDLEGKKITALVREKQKNYIKNSFTHIDFQAVSLTETIRTQVSLHFVGVAPAIKEFQAAIVTNVEFIEVEALPGDLPERIEVDLSKLAALGDAIHVKDLDVPAGVEVLTAGDEAIVVATSTYEVTEEELTEVVEGIQPELSVDRGKKEEEA